MVGHTFEHNAAVWKLRELIGSGELGDLCYIDTARLNLGLYQRDVNVIWDLAAHDISIINFLLGRLPDAVSAWGHGHASLNVEDVGYVQLRYTDLDIMAYVHVSWLDPCKVRRVTVVGTKKMAVYNDMSATERIRIYDVGLEHGPEEDSMHAMPLNYRYGDIVSPFVSASEPLTVQDSHFIDCVRTGARPRVDGRSGLATVRVLEASDRALRSRTEALLDGGVLESHQKSGPYLIPAQARRRFGGSA
jgi:predicted dehydrogenase